MKTSNGAARIHAAPHYGFRAMVGGSELNVRPEGDAQVVMCAAVEIHLVADIEAQTERADVALESAAGIQHAVDVRSAETLHGTGKRVEGGRARIKHELDAAAFYRDKRLNASIAKIHFGPKHSLKHA